MNWSFPPRVKFHMGLLLLRLAAGIFLVQSGYLTLITFRPGDDTLLTVVQVIDLFLSFAGGVLLLSGASTKAVSVGVFCWILIIHVAMGAPTHDLAQLLLFFVIFLLGPGQYSIDHKILHQKTPEGFA